MHDSLLHHLAGRIEGPVTVAGLSEVVRLVDNGSHTQARAHSAVVVRELGNRLLQTICAKLKMSTESAMFDTIDTIDR